MRSDVDRWNAKYADREPVSSIEPDPLLLKHRDLLGRGGLCIDIAGGAGDNGLYLSGLGYRTVIVDASENGLRLCQFKARRNDLSPMLVVADLDRFVLPERTFDVVLVFRYLNRALIEPIRRCLRPDGVLFYKTFNFRHLAKRPQFSKGYLLEDGELTKWFADLHCVDSNDGQAPDTSYHWVGRKTEAPSPP